MSLGKQLMAGLVRPAAEKPKAKQKSAPHHATPGGAETEKRKPLPRGQAFHPAGSLVKMSPR